jgi:hypothetical protein
MPQIHESIVSILYLHQDVYLIGNATKSQIILQIDYIADWANEKEF